ncbi:hypothetical protein BT96DRAFT_929276 [Gymnopus androsaceus JB14]|uniref:Uncharacterized protein n=1 Tax=Gymnopus androsaceus JB14 TaxID=1447944 RepID=A0A6A4GG91_9AGAR|nr:hypothetical protein BT96DRAFT_929276 [Gymnopus androsaceus JB14]
MNIYSYSDNQEYNSSSRPLLKFGSWPYCWVFVYATALVLYGDKPYRALFRVSCSFPGAKTSTLTTGT